MGDFACDWSEPRPGCYWCSTHQLLIIRSPAVQQAAEGGWSKTEAGFQALLLDCWATLVGRVGKECSLVIGVDWYGQHRHFEPCDLTLELLLRRL